MESIFEKLDEQTVSMYMNWLALATVATGMVVGILVGKVRKLLVHDLLYGFIYGMVGPLLCLSWHIVDARTSYYDHLYQDKNQGCERLLWCIIKPYPLDSVYSLVTMAIGFVVAGALLGIALAYLTRFIDSRFGISQQDRLSSRA